MKYTVLETLYSRVYYNVFVLGFVLFLISFIAAELTYGVPSRVAIDFGLGLSTIAAIGIAIFLGSGLIAKEIESRTIYMMLSRPVTRTSFLSGKLLGLLIILFSNSLILYTISLIMYFFLGGEYSNLLIWCFLFSFFEASIILLIVVMFSLILNQTLSIIVSLSIYVAGHSLTGLTELSFVKNNAILKIGAEITQFTLPNFSKLNIKDFVIYKDSLPLHFLFSATLYAFLFILLLLGITIFIFNRKSLD